MVIITQLLLRYVILALCEPLHIEHYVARAGLPIGADLALDA